MAAKMRQKDRFHTRPSKVRGSISWTQIEVSRAPSSMAPAALGGIDDDGIVASSGGMRRRADANNERSGKASSEELETP